MARDKFDYSHGDSGTKPGSALNFDENERPQAQQFDWWWSKVISRINKLWDEFSRLDSDDDGIVDAADEADTLDGQHYSDIQTWVNNSSSVPDADTVDGKHASELGLDVLEDGNSVLQSAEGMNLAGHLTATDNGDNTVTVDPSHNHDGEYVKTPEQTSSIYIQSTEPSSPSVNDLWVDL